MRGDKEDLKVLEEITIRQDYESKVIKILSLQSDEKNNLRH